MPGFAQEVPSSNPTARRYEELAAALQQERGAAGGGPSVGRLLRRALALGFSREEGKQRLAEALDEAEVHQAWSRWTEVENREEVTLRLEMIHRFGRFPGVLLDFVFFFFRSSDPILYQGAALVFGRHWQDDPALREKLEAYARERAIPLSEPVRLGGSRSRRRLFLLQTAVAGRISEEAGRIDPLPGFLAELPDHPADLSVGLLALEDRLAEGGRDLAPAADEVMQKLAADRRRRWDRITVQRWGKVLAARARQEDAEGARIERNWLGLLEGLVARLRSAGHGVGDRIGLLLQIEELAEIAVVLPASVQEGLFRRLQDMFAEETRLYLLLRLKLRALRHASRGSAFGASAILPEECSEELRALYQRTHYGEERDRSVLVGVPAEEGATGFLEYLLSFLEDRGRWLVASPEKRSLRAFLLLSETMYPVLPPERLGALLTAAGVGPVRTFLREEGVEGWTPAAAAILLRLVSWEEPGIEAFLDGRLLHRIEETRILLALVREREEGGLLAGLADAFEHRLRLGLAQDEHFDAGAFLYRIAVRDPHPSFYRLFREVAANRAYTHPDGRIFPLEEILRKMEEEAARAGDAGELGAPDLADPPVGQEDSFGAALAMVRVQLGQWRREPDLPVRLHGLVQLLGRAGGEGDGEGLLSLVARLNAGSDVILRAGYPVFSPEASGGGVTYVREVTARVAELAPRIVPQHLRRLLQMRSASQALQTSLQELEAGVGPLLPVMERRIFAEGLRRLVVDLREWQTEIAAVARLAEQEEDEERAREVIFGRISGLNSPSLRREMRRVYWSSLIAGESGEGAPGADWARTLNQLRWAVEEERLNRMPAEDREVWIEQVSGRWAELATGAMDQLYESRLVGLVRDPAFEPVRMAAPAAAVLERARRWLLDRYRLRDAAAAGRSCERLRGRRPPGLFRTAASFFLQFSAVWIALLVGGILMLDFGGAWTAMAEVKDVRGISLTFLLGVAGAYLYLSGDLRKKISTAPEDSKWRPRVSIFGRTLLFLVFCLIYAFAITGALWFLLSGTDEVVRGEGALLHVTVWAGFALFVGIFFGLLAKDAA